MCKITRNRWIVLSILFAFVMILSVSMISCGGGDGDGDTGGDLGGDTTVVVGGTPIYSAPPPPTTNTSTAPVISDLSLNPTSLYPGDRITISLNFTDSDANVVEFAIQFNGEAKYYAYDVSGVTSGYLAFNLVIQDTIGNVPPGTYQLAVFLRDQTNNISNYLYGSFTILGGTSSDTQAPTVPSNLTATATSASQINLTWSASTDNVGVSGYRVYRNGTLVATSLRQSNVITISAITSTNYSDAGLGANTQYCYQVTAYDAAGNESGKSSQACATTLSDGGGIDVSGYWDIYTTETGDIERGPDNVTITQSGNDITVFNTCFYKTTAYGTVNGTNISFSFTESDGHTTTVTGTVSGDTMSGQYSSTNGESGTWRANRVSSIPNCTADVTGYWAGTVTMYWSDSTSSTDNMALSLVQTGDNVTGTATTTDGTLNITGNVNGNIFTLNMILPCSGGDETLTLVHSVSGTTMTATSASGSACPHGVVNITGYSGTLTKMDSPPTQSNFSGTWNGSTIGDDGGPRSTTLTLDSALSGSYVITGPSRVDIHNITGVVTSGVLSFNLPVSNLDVGNPDCVNWNVQCSGTLSQNLLTMYMSCSGIFCSSGGGQPGSFTDTLNKQ